MSEREILATPPKIAISVFIDTVTVELICGDEYAAQVTYEDIIDRLQRGEGLTLSVQQAHHLPLSKEDGKNE